MHYFFNKSTLTAAIGIVIGISAYDYFSSGKVDLIQMGIALILSVLIVGLLQIFKARKG